jgi:hypothetical protein
MRYLSTLSGRALLACAALFLLGPALGSLLGDTGLSIRLQAILPMLCALCAIVFAATGLASHGVSVMVGIAVFPFAAWLFYPGLLLMVKNQSGAAAAVLVLAIVLAALALRPRREARS